MSRSIAIAFGMLISLLLAAILAVQLVVPAPAPGLCQRLEKGS